jgi:hypothetical protein
MGKWLEEAFLQGRLSPRFRLQTHAGSTFLGLNTPILHVHIIAQVRLAASFVCPATVSFRGYFGFLRTIRRVTQWRRIPLFCPVLQ